LEPLDLIQIVVIESFKNRLEGLLDTREVDDPTELAIRFSCDIDPNAE
jgi:hypothetical protein